MEQVFAGNGVDRVEISVAALVILIFQRVDDIGAVLRNDDELRVRLARMAGERDDEIDHTRRRLALGLWIVRTALRRIWNHAAPVIVAVDDVEVRAVEPGRDDFVEPARAVRIENDLLPVFVPIAHLARVGPVLVPRAEPRRRCIGRIASGALVGVGILRPVVLPVIAEVGRFADRDVGHDDRIGALTLLQACDVCLAERAFVRAVLGKIHDDQIVRLRLEVLGRELLGGPALAGALQQVAPAAHQPRAVGRHELVSHPTPPRVFHSVQLDLRLRAARQQSRQRVEHDLDGSMQRHFVHFIE